MAAGELPQVVAAGDRHRAPARPRARRLRHEPAAAPRPRRPREPARHREDDRRAHPAPSDGIAAAEVAPPGFINFRLSETVARAAGRRDRRRQARRSATSRSATAQRVQVEFVSANPTGPLTAGNGRGAAIGSVLASVLEAAGYDVEREYLVNDAGTQTEVFGRTLVARYQQLVRQATSRSRRTATRRVHDRPREAHPRRVRRHASPTRRSTSRRAEMVLRGVDMIVEGIQRRPAARWA